MLSLVDYERCFQAVLTCLCCDEKEGEFHDEMTALYFCLDSPAFGKPTKPTSAMVFNSNSSSLCSPGSPAMCGVCTTNNKGVSDSPQLF